MKTPALSVAILWGCAVLLCAGPERYSGKEMTQAAVEPPGFNWTGFYIGGLVGYKFGESDVDMDLFGGWDASEFAMDKSELQSAGSENLDRDRVEAGGVIGYNHQFNRLVVGAELTGAAVWPPDKSRNVEVPTGDFYDIHTSVDTTYLVTAGPRLGFACGRFLPYITGGVALGDLELSQLIIDQSIFYHQGGSKSEDKVGWMAGVGLQVAINNHWSIRAQYQYVDLGCVEFESAGTVPYRNFLGSHEACLVQHNANFALIYQF